ncbi:MAG TPA: peptide-methionine (S)-S-oxide reductase MsrA [Candidatus Paceibacterota bacterium]|nr:peptide-methionine (S)-S-oxide reductase MsrA [Candidatus Paceibacterota bacterium]
MTNEQSENSRTAVFGGGCFWCTEAVFQMLKGVLKVESGYAGGSTGSPQAAPTYEQVSSGNTGHAEVIRVTYDPSVISYQDLLTVFFGSHDPTTPNKQGADVGEQYRSIILYETPEEKEIAEKLLKEVQESLTDGTRVVTQVVPLEHFYKAEDYHQNYFNENKSAPYCELVIEPKVEKVRKRFHELLNDNAS